MASDAHGASNRILHRREPPKKMMDEKILKIISIVGRKKRGESQSRQRLPERLNEKRAAVARRAQTRRGGTKAHRQYPKATERQFCRPRERWRNSYQTRWGPKDGQMRTGLRTIPGGCCNGQVKIAQRHCTRSYVFLRERIRGVGNPKKEIGVVSARIKGNGQQERKTAEYCPF